MQKRVTDLNEAIAKRLAKAEVDMSPGQEKPRLAERLVELAPLARGPVTIEEPVPTAPPDGDLSQLSDAPRFRRNDGSGATGATGTALIPNPEVVALVPAAETPARLVRRTSPPPLPVDPATLRRPVARTRLPGFIIGLSTASALGLALYALLV